MCLPGPFSGSWWEVCFTETRVSWDPYRLQREARGGEAEWGSAGGSSKQATPRRYLMDRASMFGKVMNGYLTEFSLCAQVVCSPRAPLGSALICYSITSVYIVSVSATELLEG